MKGLRKVAVADLRRFSYPYPNDLGRDLDWCLRKDLQLIRDYIRYAFEDEWAARGWPIKL